jgi:hypothetical protein
MLLEERGDPWPHCGQLELRAADELEESPRIGNRFVPEREVAAVLAKPKVDDGDEIDCSPVDASRVP